MRNAYLLALGQSDARYDEAWEREREQRTWELAEAFPDTPPSEDEIEAMYAAHLRELGVSDA